VIHLALLTFWGVFRDKVFRGILLTGFVFLLIPSISTLSMRQVTELSLTLTLSLTSFILLLLSIFLGGTTLWKDMERRYTFGILSMPISRTSYVLGKFAGIAGFIFLTAMLLGAVCCLVVWYVSGAYPPDRPVVWSNVLLAIFFDMLKYILLIAYACFFSTVSTSFFLPIFGTISTFLVGSATQGVYEYVHSAAGQSFSPFFTKTVTLLYYLLPNFSAFDLNVNAIYAVGLSLTGLALTCGYFSVYTAILLTLSSIIFSRREIQ
jgi:ABC-type transport system involved in multi-copper enzyme maturation permease subunit